MKRTDFTQQEIVEYILTSKHPEHFINSCSIQHPIEGAIRFNPYFYQYELIDHIHSNRLSITNSARQMGCTTTLSLYALWAALTHNNHTVGFFAPRTIHCLEFMDRLRFAHDHLPHYLKMKPRFNNKRHIEFENGSRVMAFTISPNAARGMGINTVILDSLAFCNKSTCQNFWTAVYPVIANSAKVIAISSPGESEGVFYDLWMNAPRNRFAKLTLPWHNHPDRGQEFETHYRDLLGDDKFEQEFNNQFRT